MPSRTPPPARRSQHTPAQRRVAEALRQWREEANLTQRGLAKRLGVSQPVVSKIEKSERSVELSELLAWARATGREPVSAATSLTEELVRLGGHWQARPVPARDPEPGQGELADLLIHWREATRTGGRELSEQLGRPHVYASQVELGHRDLDPLAFLDWAAACGVKPEDAAQALVKLYKRVRKQRAAGKAAAAAPSAAKGRRRGG